MDYCLIRLLCSCWTFIFRMKSLLKKYARTNRASSSTPQATILVFFLLILWRSKPAKRNSKSDSDESVLKTYMCHVKLSLKFLLLDCNHAWIKLFPNAIVPLSREISNNILWPWVHSLPENLKSYSRHGKGPL